MVEQRPSYMDEVFQALSDSTRRQMLRDLAASDRTVSELAAPHPMSLAAASKHIRVLENAGLIRREVEGRTHRCHLEAGPLAAAHDELGFYEQFWTSSLNTLDRLLRDEAAQEPESSRTTSDPQPKDD
ncbi:ArsR/SmtB family transcription factor [Henriciella pelagia]|uniref:ArsR/SmtB family transcription factor n=1 Tax=Henriciella pelagia TaxID=1977912 RepID=UPI003512632C